MSDDPNKGADDPNPNPAPTPAEPNPAPEPAKDAMTSLKEGRIHIIEPGEVVIDGRAGF